MNELGLQILNTVLSVTITGIISILGGVLLYQMKKRDNEHKERYEAELKAAKEKADAEAAEKKANLAKQKIYMIGLESVLRTDLTYLYQRSEKQGWISMDDLRNFERMYTIYETMHTEYENEVGPNGIMTAKAEELRKMSNTPPVRSRKSTKSA